MALPYGVGLEQVSNVQQSDSIAQTCYDNITYEEGSPPIFPFLDPQCILAILPNASANKPITLDQEWTLAGWYANNVPQDALQQEHVDFLVEDAWAKKGWITNPSSTASPTVTDTMPNISDLPAGGIYTGVLLNKDDLGWVDDLLGVGGTGDKLVQNVEHSIGSIGDIFGFISDPSNLLRLGAVVGGAVLIIYGFTKMSSE